MYRILYIESGDYIYRYIGTPHCDSKFSVYEIVGDGEQNLFVPWEFKTIEEAKILFEATDTIKYPSFSILDILHNDIYLDENPLLFDIVEV
jgi:hypothetical protein